MRKAAFLPLIVVLFSSVAFSAYEDGDGLDYVNIVRKLSKNQFDDAYDEDPLANVKIHLGVGMPNTVFTVRHPNGDRTFGAQRGIQVAMGIDLLSKNWLAETAFRNYGDTKYENAIIALKEFDLKVLYQDRFTPIWGFKLGGGLAARYMSIDYASQGYKYTKEYSTPATVLQGGIATYLSSMLSIGADASMRTALVDETPDKGAVDFTLRLDGHF